MTSPSILDYVMILIIIVYLVSRWVDYEASGTNTTTSLVRIITESIVIINITCNGFKYFSMGSWEKRAMLRMEKVMMEIKEYITDLKMDMVQASNRSATGSGDHMSSKDFSDHLMRSIVKNLDTKKYFKSLGVDIVDILLLAGKHGVDQVAMCEHICDRLGVSLFKYSYKALTTEDKVKIGAVPAFFQDMDSKRPSERLEYIHQRTPNV